VLVSITCISTVPCTGGATLDGKVIMSGGKVVGVTTRKAKRKTKRAANYGSTTFTVPAGKTMVVKVPLNARGRSLLTKFKRLPALLTVTLKQASGPPTIVVSQKVTLKSKTKAKHKGKK
jgi:hypothetical protein